MLGCVSVAWPLNGDVAELGVGITAGEAEPDWELGESLDGLDDVPSRDEPESLPGPEPESLPEPAVDFDPLGAAVVTTGSGFVVEGAGVVVTGFGFGVVVTEGAVDERGQRHGPTAIQYDWELDFGRAEWRMGARLD